MAFSKLYKCALVLVCLLVAHSAHAARFLYTGGHYVGEQRVAALGYTYNEFYPDDAGWTSALSGGFGSFDAIVVGEGQRNVSISPQTQSAIAAFVRAGGRLVIFGDHAGNLDFLNAVFGYSAVLSYGCNYDQQIAGSLRPNAVTHTGFVSGAPNLRDLSCTSALVTTSLPSTARIIYSGQGNTQAFTTRYGSGQFAWLGWDYCCGATPNENDWYFVLASALGPNNQICSTTDPRFGAQKRCQQVCEVRQTPTGKATLIANYKRLYGQPPVCAIALPQDSGGGG